MKHETSGTPTTYTSIAHYYDWIEETIKNYTAFNITNRECGGIYENAYDLNQWIPTQLHIKALLSGLIRFLQFADHSL